MKSELLRLRNVALLAVADDLKSIVGLQSIVELKASSIRQRQHNGGLSIVTDRGITHLTDSVAPPLLDYMEAARLWNQPTWLFWSQSPEKPLSARGAESALRRVRRA